MIIYLGGLDGDNGFSLLLRFYGSVLHRALPHGLISAAINLCLRFGADYLVRTLSLSFAFTETLGFGYAELCGLWARAGI